MIFPALTSPTVAALALAALAPPPEDDQVCILAPANEPLVVEAGDTTYSELLRRYQDVTGESFTYSAEVESLLERRLLVEERIEAAVGEVHTTVQELLVQAGFWIQVVFRDDFQVLQLRAIGDGGDTSANRRSLTWLPFAAIGAARRNPAVMVMTVVPVEGTDVEPLGRALETLTRGPWPGLVRVLPNASALVLIGTGERVAAMVDLVRPEPLPDDEVLMEQVPLRRISSEDAIEALTPYLDDWREDGVPRPDVVGNPDKSAVVVIGTRRGIELVRKAIEELDR